MGELIIKLNDIAFNEKRYVIEEILGPLFELDIRIEIDDSIDFYELHYDKKVLTLCNVIFSRSFKWLDSGIRPKTVNWISEISGYESLSISDLPVFFGSCRNKIDVSNTVFEIDLIGSLFYFLSGYEELLSSKVDNKGRVDQKDLSVIKMKVSSHPFLNYYVRMFAFWFNHHCETKIKIKNQSDSIVSLDIDDLSSKVYGWKQLGKEFAKDLFVYKDPVTLARRFFSIIFGYYKWDPLNYNSFLLKVKKEFNARIVINFMIAEESPKVQFDRNYSWESNEMKENLIGIENNDFEIGVHPSISSGLDKKVLKSELDSFKNKTKFYKGMKWCRYHYLAYNFDFSFQTISKFNWDFESSMGFSNFIGFKVGYTFPYIMYDLENRRSLNLIQIPFQLMDTTINSSNVSSHEIFGVLDKIKAEKGVFCFCGHNNFINRKGERKKLISYLHYMRK